MGAELCIAVCDDMEHDRVRTASLTGEVMASLGVSCAIETYDSGKALLAGLYSGKRFQIMLLDVMMDELDGMELARVLRESGNESFIVFISGNREMAMYGYEVSALRFLAKPLDQQKLTETLQCCLDRLETKEEILLPTLGGHHRISVKDIQYVEAFERGSRLMISNRRVISKWKFSEVMQVLPQSLFLQCHRAFAVNLSEVTSIRKYEFALKSKTVIPISKGRYADVQRVFAEYLNN